MTMKLGPGEPPLGPWQVMPISDLIRLVFDRDRKPLHRPWIVAVDGRGGGGKSTTADLLHRFVPASAVVHTDDIAWHHSFFDWSELLIEGVLKPLHAGEAVHYRPPGWESKGRSGEIEVRTGLELVLVEGVGASRNEVTPWIDRSIWVQSDLDEAERRAMVRDGDTEEARAFWCEWMAEEIEFLQRQRPWERATVVVNGTPMQPYDRTTEIFIAVTPR